MVEPITSALALAAGTELVKSAVRATVDHARALVGRDKASEAEVQASYAHAARLLSAILVECRTNLERVRLLAPQDGSIHYAPFYFDISDALFPEFCRIAPNPLTIAHLQRVIAACKRVDCFLRIAANARSGKAYDYGKVKGFADDALKKDVIGAFNVLVECACGLSEAADSFAHGVLTPISLEAPIDHSIL